MNLKSSRGISIILRTISTLLQCCIRYLCCALQPISTGRSPSRDGALQVSGVAPVSVTIHLNVYRETGAMRSLCI